MKKLINFLMLMLAMPALAQTNDLVVKDRAFFELSTTLTFYTIAVALAQIGNRDEIGKHSASYMVDGDIHFGIGDSIAATLRVKDHHLVTIKKAPEKPRAIMKFKDLDLAAALFNGTANALECVCNGSIEIHGMASMIDNMNRLLDRVALYLG